MCRPPSLRAFKRVSGEDKSVGNGLDTVNIVDCGKSVIYSEWVRSRRTYPRFPTSSPTCNLRRRNEWPEFSGVGLRFPPVPRYLGCRFGHYEGPILAIPGSKRADFGGFRSRFSQILGSFWGKTQGFGVILTGLEPKNGGFEAQFGHFGGKTKGLPGQFGHFRAKRAHFWSILDGLSGSFGAPFGPFGGET